VENPSNKSILTTISVGLRKDGKLYENIYKSPVKDLGELYERATKKIKWKETFGFMKPNQTDESGNSNQSKKRNNGGNENEG